MRAAVGVTQQGRRRVFGTGRAAGVVGIAALVALAGCTSSGHDSSAGSPPQPVGSKGTIPGSTSSTTSGAGSSADGAPSSSAAASPLDFSNSAEGHRISPTQPVTVTVAHGTLTSVVMRNDAGRTVTGELDSNGTSWHNTEDLGYDRTYRVVATAKDDDGQTVVKRSVVRTLAPQNQTQPYIDTLYGTPIENGGKYGVAMVVNVAFDEQIPDKAAAEKALTVTTTPQVTGSWYWSDASHVHWRPQNYWPSGTKVTVDAKVYGKNLGDGLYGASDQSVSFSIGRKQVTIADDTAPAKVNKVRVYDAAGKVIRTMNTSMGEHTGTYTKNGYINFYTLDGTYTVLNHENPAIMSSDSYGLPANAPGGYAPEKVYWATKISTDGIYLHELDTTVWAQDSGQDVSHGCLNLNYDNASWFYKHSMVGDPVIVHGAKGAPKLEVWQGGDWSVPWAKWLKGSALG